MNKRTYQYIAVFMFFIAIISLIAGILVGRAQILSNPVCHSITEDSVISDCSYHNGAWYVK